MLKTTRLSCYAFDLRFMNHAFIESMVWSEFGKEFDTRAEDLPKLAPGTEQDCLAVCALFLFECDSIGMQEEDLPSAYETGYLL